MRIAPDFTNGRVALGVALQRAGKTGDAFEVLREAVRRSPDNPWAHRNLGACLLSKGSTEEGIACLRRALELAPADQQSLLGLATALEAHGDTTEADRVYRKVIDVDEYSPLAEAARQALNRRAGDTFRERGGPLRADAVAYCAGALDRFENLGRDEVGRIAFEIALLGQHGLDVNDPAKKYQLKSLPGSFSGLHLVCLMYVGFKQIAPEQDVGFDLSREYARALGMHSHHK